MAEGMKADGAQPSGVQGSEKEASDIEAPQDQQFKPSANDTSSIPNGGIKAWLQVLGTFFIFFNTW